LQFRVWLFRKLRESVYTVSVLQVARRFCYEIRAGEKDEKVLKRFAAHATF